MLTLNNAILIEICLEFVKDIEKLQKFVLTGKGNFLAYIQIFQSVQKYTTFYHWKSITLNDGNELLDESTWKHLLYLCGRYTRTLSLENPSSINKYVMHGLKENRRLEDVKATDFKDPKFVEEFVSVIGCRSFKKLAGNPHLFQKINDGGQELKLKTLEICGRYNCSRVLCLKNFSASEIRLYYCLIDPFVEEIKEAQKEDKLNPYLKEVKEWYISASYDNQRVKPVLPLLDVLKTISPKMEKCTIESFEGSRPSRKISQQYLSEVDKLVSCIKEGWGNLDDFRLHINLEFQFCVDSDLMDDVDSLRECFQDFPDFEIEELSSESWSRSVASKKISFTDNFSLDFRITTLSA